MDNDPRDRYRVLCRREAESLTLYRRLIDDALAALEQGADRDWEAFLRREAEARRAREECTRLRRAWAADLAAEGIDVSEPDLESVLRETRTSLDALVARLGQEKDRAAAERDALRLPGRRRNYRKEGSPTQVDLDA